MSIHSTFFHCVAHEYDPHPYYELPENGELYFCNALGTNYVRVSLDDSADPQEGKSVVVDITVQQALALAHAILKEYSIEGNNASQ